MVGSLYTAELALMLEAARAAGQAAMAYFRPGDQTSAVVTMKPGDSPVTEADLAANAILRQHLQLARPDYGWISEEDADSTERLRKQRVFIVDPIDGTRAFIAGKPHWCVSIGLIEDGQAVAGVIHLPVSGLTYQAARGLGAYLGRERVTASSAQDMQGRVFAGPKSIYDGLNNHHGHAIAFAPRVPSLAYRLAMAASGEVDLAAASNGAHDWDIAAADIILAEAGASFVDLEGKRLAYNGTSLKRGVLLAGAPSLVEAALSSPGLRTGQ